GWVGVYGIAVILVTVILRILIWPLHAKSTRTMKRMSQLTPKMNEVREKYKDNPQKQQQEMMTLYKTYGVNPFGGCLPMFLQIPIFFGFYRMLQSAVELRGQSFLWVEDLSMPDTIAQVGGIDVNPLPLLMAVTMVLQMAVTPTSGDKMQQRMFMIMPVVFLFICYNFASALALYWTTQNIFAIGQTWLMGKMPQPTLEKKKPAPKGPRGGAGGDGGGKPKKPKGPRTGGAGKSALKKNG
ncbi:MAG: membrane protein insertase YidC, partial [Verrucomicrobiales bacterium]|nr:membrane protein insertase YidC [Verrucomicrobiales bacterium]